MFSCPKRPKRCPHTHADHLSSSTSTSSSSHCSSRVLLPSVRDRVRETVYSTLTRSVDGIHRARRLRGTHILVCGQNSLLVNPQVHKEDSLLTHSQVHEEDSLLANTQVLEVAGSGATNGDRTSYRVFFRNVSICQPLNLCTTAVVVPLSQPVVLPPKPYDLRVSTLAYS